MQLLLRKVLPKISVGINTIRPLEYSHESTATLHPLELSTLLSLL